MDTEHLKLIMASPVALFALMLLASVGSALKQLSVARRNGASMSCKEYLLHWPETSSTLIGNVLALAVLLHFDVLNVASAIGVGYGVNSLSDLLTTYGRSAKLNVGP